MAASLLTLLSLCLMLSVSGVRADTIPANFQKILTEFSKSKMWCDLQDPEYAQGTGLFKLINGGAEIYHEYGFRQAVFVSCKDNKDRPFTIEIYEMLSSDAAYGVYTFKTNQKAQALKIGGAAKLSDYYLNLWQGNYAITVTGLVVKKEIQPTLVQAAKSLVKGIDQKAELPHLVKRFTQASRHLEKPVEIKYVKGNLALGNTCKLSPNLPRTKEAIIAKYKGFQICVLIQDNKPSSTKSIGNTIFIFQAEPNQPHLPAAFAKLKNEFKEK